MGFDVVAIDHVQLAMPAGERADEDAERFYAGVLGFERLPKPAVLAARGGAWFARGPVQLHLGVEADFRPARKAHPALLVRDLTHLAERLAAAGCTVRWDEDNPGVTRCYTEDPFGNRIELIEAGSSQP